MNESIEQKAPKPPGLLPKHVQSWLILGLAILMVIIMWLTGGNKSPKTAKTGATSAGPQPPAEISEAKVAELQNRIQELQRQQLIARNALEEQARMLGAKSMPPEGNQPNRSVTPSSLPDESGDSLRADRERRTYLSLFASNVALSYRKDQHRPQDLAVPESSSAEGAHQDDEITELAPIQLNRASLRSEPILPLQGATIPQPPSASSGLESKGNSDQPESQKSVNTTSVTNTPSDARDSGAGTYILFEGTILEAALINRLDGSFSGPVECLLTTDVYSHDRQHLLIPAGTKAFGEAKKVEALGQTRLAVLFHRLIMPDGYSVSLDQFQGLDQIGDTGLRDKVNNHYLRIFGASLAIGALGAVAEAGTGSTFTASGSDLMRQGFAESSAQSSERILDRFLNILPTLTIREGHRIKIYLSGDLALPDYHKHKTHLDI